jgi:hypothetical protein
MKLQRRKATQTLAALNTLASLVADYGHILSAKERHIYGRARKWLISFYDVDSAA